MTSILEAKSFDNGTEIALRAQAGVISDYNIRDICLAAGPAEGVSFAGNVVRISEDLCLDLASGDVRCILVTYSVVGIHGCKFPKTAIFNLSKKKSGPIISSHIVREPFSSDGTVCFDLLSEYSA